MISVVILTKNEEKDLATCLGSLTWCEDVHVLDSGSTDSTVEIARRYGASVCSNPFKSFGQQRNFALDNLPILKEWILFFDADEVSTYSFQKALTKEVQEAGPEIAGFYLCWKMMLDGTWLKKCDNFPKWQFRLLRKGRARFTDFGHGQKEGEVKGNIGFIKEPYLHYSFSKGWSDWIERHNRYSTQEAKSRIYNCPPFKYVFNSNESIRNPALKSWLSKLPGWPFLRFVQAYVVKLGFVEGTAGFIYCVNMAYHEFLIQIKIRELKKSTNNKVHQMVSDSPNNKYKQDVP